MNELKETADLMASADYKERFRAEFAQLAIRLKKLKRTLYSIDYTVNSNCPRGLLSMQYEAMNKYLDVLLIRAQIEGIDVGDLIQD